MAKSQTTFGDVLIMFPTHEILMHPHRSKPYWHPCTIDTVKDGETYVRLVSGQVLGPCSPDGLREIPQDKPQGDLFA